MRIPGESHEDFLEKVASQLGVVRNNRDFSRQRRGKQGTLGSGYNQGAFCLGSLLWPLKARATVNQDAKPSPVFFPLMSAGDTQLRRERLAFSSFSR